MRSTVTENDELDFDAGQRRENDTLVVFADHHLSQAERFPDVEDLLERLTDNTARVASSR